MPDSQIAPYGTWKSPVTSDLVVAAGTGLSQVMVDGNALYWAESRPAEGGRTVVVRRGADGILADMTPPGFNVRTRVHEYGGGAYLAAGGSIVFSNDTDQRLYRQQPGNPPVLFTAEGALRYADAVFDRQHLRLICICEDHTTDEVVNTVAALDLHSAAGQAVPRVLLAGNDFYATPRLSPDGSRLAWLTWNHPNMPWDGTELWVGEVAADGSIAAARRVAGGPDESIFQPTWSPDGVLCFVSDRSGWWNLYRLPDAAAGVPEPLCPMEAEFGLPQWVFRMETYAWESSQRLVCSYSSGGRDSLALLDTSLGTLEPIATPYTSIAQPKMLEGRVAFIGAAPTEAAALVLLDPASGDIEVVRRSSDMHVEPGSISVAEAITFPTTQGRTAHAFFYPPRNRDFAAPADEQPPLLVMSHGGPTAATSDTLSLKVQYWTSRGFAVLDVNYGGSVGYGRAYRQQLQGQWGVVDVEDCVYGARHLVERGVVDSRRLMIRGSSAGGYTTLCALTFHDLFTAGASLYGIGDLELLAADTHKFESRYLDSLIGPYPQQRDLYRQRSPIHAVEQLNCPVIFLQGLEDKIVPPGQAERMVAALRARGVPVAYVTFADEQHGFRKAENIKRALESELSFYAQVFGFAPADELEAVEVIGL
jgi:dipeptidyl aminopeptidase/acylaminoacyl peptidase